MKRFGRARGADDGHGRPHRRAEGGIGEDLSEVKDLALRFVVQETWVPIKALGRRLAFGLGGAVLVATGLALLSLAALRGMQEETGTFRGNWSWAPYGIVVAGLVACIVTTVALALRHGPDEGERRRKR